MLYYKRIDLSEGDDPAKSSNSKEFMICHYCFCNHGFKSQDYACNACHDLLMQFVNIRDNAIITVKNVDFCCIIHVRKSHAINLFKKTCG